MIFAILVDVMYGYQETYAAKSEVGQRFDGKIGFWSTFIYLLGNMFFLPQLALTGFMQGFPINTAYILFATTAIAVISVAVSLWVNLSFQSCIIKKRTKHCLHTGILWSNWILVVSAPMIIATLVYTYSELVQSPGGVVYKFIIPGMILLTVVSVFLAPRQLRHDKKLLKLLDEMYGDTQHDVDIANPQPFRN